MKSKSLLGNIGVQVVIAMIIGALVGFTMGESASISHHWAPFLSI